MNFAKSTWICPFLPIFGPKLQFWNFRELLDRHCVSEQWMPEEGDDQGVNFRELLDRHCVSEQWMPEEGDDQGVNFCELLSPPLCARTTSASQRHNKAFFSPPIQNLFNSLISQSEPISTFANCPCQEEVCANIAKLPPFSVGILILKQSIQLPATCTFWFVYK